jgi:ribonuclease G
MRDEILINVTPRETRVAVLENGVLHEVLIERAARRGLVGNIYQGQVARVLPGMQAAFVDIGLERAAFLHASDILAACTGEPDGERGEPAAPEPPPRADGQQPGILQLVHEGQTVLVQVIKDPLGTKGARLTTQITLPSRYLVLLPGGDCVGVSSRIEHEAERARLRDWAQRTRAALQSQGARAPGLIVRTVGEGADEAALDADLQFLCKLRDSVAERARNAPPGTAVYQDLPLPERVLRDLVQGEAQRVLVDSRETYQRLSEFAARFLPQAGLHLEHYPPGDRPLFELYGIEDEIQRALERKVPLKSGGHLVIDQTEAMTTIDVNTGAYVGRRNLEETIFKTNLEAAQAIARQLRLRNLGGIIILDFIDMKEPDHRRQVLRALERALEKDHARCSISEISRLGLVEMTRKRTRESLSHILCAPCPACSGRGVQKTPETVCYEIFREILREARAFDAEGLLVLASQEVADLLRDEESASLAELEAFIGKPIRFQAEALYTQEQYDVVLL